MPTPSSRPSLTTTLDQRYAKQHAGGAFEVKNVLGGPGVELPPGKVIDSTSALGTAFQNPNGFQVKMPVQVSQFKVVQTNDQQGTSRYVIGLDTRKYHR